MTAPLTQNRKRMKRILLLLVAVLALVPGHAEDKAEEPVKVKVLLKNAKSALKNNNNQEQNEKALLEALTREDVDDKQRAEFLYLCSELQRNLNDRENMKLYLKQEYDTVKFFNSILKMDQHLLRCDSVEQVIGKFKWRDKGRNTILRYRANLLSGGKWLLRRGNVAEAYEHFDTYLRLPDEPMMASQTAIKEDSVLTKVAYWATISAFNAHQYGNALKYIDRAVAGAGPSLRAYLTEYKAVCQRQTQDTTGYVRTLKEGTKYYGSHDFFYLNLMDYFMAADSADVAVKMSKYMLQTQGERALYWYGMCRAYQRLCDYDEMVRCADNTLALDSTFVDAHYMKGVAYLNQATAFSKTMSSDIRSAKFKRDRVRLNSLYQLAREPLETYRTLRPEDKQHWGEPLYTIYLNLNLGKEFSEIEKELNVQ